MPTFLTSTALSDRLPKEAAFVVDVLEAMGAEAWVVGGWVRDAVRGETAHDVDVATSARWPEAAAALGNAGASVHETGTAHGTITAVVGDMPIEVTTYRVEGRYSDHRHPDDVRFVDDIACDLARRDFTINAMAYHPERGLLDPFGGARDLETGVIRAVGDPVSRFGEDALRVLRAVRFACRLRFAIEPLTQAAVSSQAPSLSQVASERIGIEMDGIVRSGRMAWALRREREALVAAIPELAPLYGFDQRSVYHAYDVAGHTACVCGACEAFTAGQADMSLRWAALLHDIAKPPTFSLDELGHGHFFGHPEIGAGMARAIMGRLALPGPLVRETCALIRLHDLPLRPTSRSVRRLVMHLGRACPGRAAPLAYALIDLKRSDAVAKARPALGYAAELDEVAHRLRLELDAGSPVSVADLAVSGRDVMSALHLEPGPAVGLALDSLLAAVVGGEVPNERETLLALL